VNANEPASTPLGWWPTQASNIIRGIFLTLGIVVLLEDHPDSETTTLALVGATLAVIVGGIFGKVVEKEITQQRRLTPKEFGQVTLNYSLVGGGALPAIASFAAAWMGLLSSAAATYLAIIAGIGLLGSLSYSAARSAGSPAGRCLKLGVETALVGVVALLITVILRLT